MVKFLKINIGVNQDSKIKIGYINNYDENNQYHQEFIQAINAILFNTKKERYNYIYDTVCNYLDGYFYGKNLCDFKDNQCGEKRGTTSRIGCCHHFRVKSLGPFTELVPCEHLKDDYTCGVKCISCKLFTCDYLEKKGVKFRITMSMTPPLLSMLDNKLLQKKYINYLKSHIELSSKELKRTAGDERLNKLSKYYFDRYSNDLHLFKDVYKCNLIEAFKHFQDIGVLEIITCGATHRLFPYFICKRKNS